MTHKLRIAIFFLGLLAASAQAKPTGEAATEAQAAQWRQCILKHDIRKSGLKPSQRMEIWTSFKDACGFRPSPYLAKSAIEQGKFVDENFVYDVVNNSVYSKRIKKMAGKRYDVLRYAAEVTTEYYFIGENKKVVVASAVNFADEQTAVCMYADLNRDTVYLGHVDRGIVREAFYEDIDAYEDPEGGNAYASCLDAMIQHTKEAFGK